MANLLPIANVCLQHKSTFGLHYRTGSPGQLGLRVAGFPGHWVAGSQNVTQFHVWPHVAIRAVSGWKQMNPEGGRCPALEQTQTTTRTARDEENDSRVHTKTS